MDQDHNAFPRIEAVGNSAMAGAIAANSMTLLRMMALRHGLIEKTVPQVIEEWMVDELNLATPHSHVGHHALDQFLHVSYGGMLGAIDGAIFHRTRPATFAHGLLMGIATWAFGAFLLMPLIGASHSALKSDLRENSVNILSHLAFGLGYALLTKELYAQIKHGRTTSRQRQATRVG